MAKDKLTGRVSYRLGSQAFKQVQRLAAGQDISANEWCRQVVLEKLRSQSQTPRSNPSAQPKAEESKTEDMTLAERIMIEEVMKVRWLLQYGVRHYAMKKTQMTVEEWQYFIDQANGGGKFLESLRKWLEVYGIEVKLT